MTKDKNGKADVTVIHGPPVPMMKFGATFLAWTPEKQIDYLKKLASSQNHALDLMQKERNALLVERAVSTAQAESAQKALDIQKTITRNALTKQNEGDQQAAQRIQQLEGQLGTYRTIVKLVQDHGS